MSFVNLILDGNERTLEIVLDRLKNNVPCIAVIGSGRMADILGHACQNSISDVDTGGVSLSAQTIEELREMFSESDIYNKKDKGIGMVLECIQYSQFITAYVPGYVGRTIDVP